MVKTDPTPRVLLTLVVPSWASIIFDVRHVPHVGRCTAPPAVTPSRWASMAEAAIGRA